MKRRAEGRDPNQLMIDWVGKGAGSQEPGGRSNTKPDEPAVASAPDVHRPRLYTDDPPQPLPGEYREGPAVAALVKRPEPSAARRRQRETLQVERATHRRRISSRIPVPRPLPEAVTAGHFGHDAAGKPIRPSADEVRNITETHADTLMNLLIEQHQADSAGTAADRERWMKGYEAGLAKYAESFGQPAAERLRSHVQRLAGESLPSRSGEARSR